MQILGGHAAEPWGGLESSGAMLGGVPSGAALEVFALPGVLHGRYLGSSGRV